MFLLPQGSIELKESENKGRGVFTNQDIAPGIIIGDYLGKIINPAEEDSYDNGEHFYAMYYSDTALVAPDPQQTGIHLLNHSCAPNCWMYTYKGHTLYFSLRHIFPGEELTVAYLLSPLDKDCDPCTHLCDCGSAICFQTMHLSKKAYKEWEEFETKKAAETQAEEVSFGQDLQKLSEYPESIPDDPIYTLFGSTLADAEKRTDQEVPSLLELRKLIRETGKRLDFTKLNLRVLGLLQNLIITENL